MSMITQPNGSPPTASHGRSRSSAGRALVLTAGLLAIAGIAVACSSDSDSAEGQPTSADSVQTALVELRSAPGCGCCVGWAEYMESYGYTVDAREDVDLAEFKEARGVAAEAQSCHTAIIDGYTIEGHVPVEAIEDLLAQRPELDGIALPGMPQGSPGMPGEKLAPFVILAIDDGTTTIFGEY